MSLKVRAVIVADEIRKEVSGKDIIIGAYGGDIITPTMPAPLEIALWIEFERMSETLAKGELEMHLPNGAPEPFRLQFEFNAPPDSSASMSTPRVGTEVIEDGELVVLLRTNEGEPVEIIRKSIRAANRDFSATSRSA